MIGQAAGPLPPNPDRIPAVATEPDPVVLLLPVFNDWRAVGLLLPGLAEALEGVDGPVGVLLVDDGSTDAVPDDLCAGLPTRLSWLRVLRLRRNLGHQRAIAVGLCHVYDTVPCRAVVVMDADGEDKPEDAARLIAQADQGPGNSIVFAERRRRAESLVFKAFYRLYRTLHRILTGTGVRVGNFSLIPRDRLASLVVVSELWIHYAASVFRSRQPIATLPTTRGQRLDGQSRMNFVALVVHGLSAISVYSDVVFTRLVVAAAVVAALSVTLLGAAVAVRLGTELAVPGWATYVAGFLLIVLLQAAMFAVALTFQILGARQQAPVVPQRDYVHYVASVRDLTRGASGA